MSRIVLMLALLLLSVNTNAQIFPDANGESLKGITTFDARFYVRTWLNVTTDEDQFVQQGQASFELALRRDGVVVHESAPNYLVCDVSVAEDAGLVMFTYRIGYWDYSIDDVHHLLWVYAGLTTVGSSLFNGEMAAQRCADRFANEWLKWNPK